MNEVLLYGPIWYQSSVDFINAVNTIADGESLKVRVNSTGGDVHQGWGMVSKFQEFEGEKSVKIDGQASSMALFFALYADKDKVECMDFSQGILHRASFGLWFEENYMDESGAEFLANANANLYKIAKARIDVEAFENLKGVKLKDVFSMDGRIDVNLSASDMKKIGLVSKVINSTPKQKAKIEANYQRSIAAFAGLNIDAENNTPTPKPEANNNAINNKQIQTTMTREELESQHPALFASIVNIGVEKGRKAEANRVGAWSAWSAIDPEAVKAGIESGEEITPKDTSEFQVKALNASNKKALEAEASRQAELDAQNGNPPAAEGGEELTAAQKLEAEVMQKINPKTV